MFNRKEVSKCEGKAAVDSGEMFVYERSFMQAVALTTGRAIVVFRGTPGASLFTIPSIG